MSWQQDEAGENRERVQREIAGRRAAGELLEPLGVPPGGRKLCQSFWGQAWCRHLEAHAHHEGRLPRGRSCLRRSQVFDLKVEPGRVCAVVAGARLHDTVVRLRPLAPERWQRLVAAGAGQVGSLLDLLAGKLGEGLLQLLTDPDLGLFPQPGEMRFDCTCPDDADLCEHAAAVLYGVGLRLDQDPGQLFTLRGVNQADLLNTAGSATAADLESDGAAWDGADLAGLFGIELAEDGRPPDPEAPPPALT